MTRIKKWLLFCIGSFFIFFVSYFTYIFQELPQTKSLEDYNPRLITFVLDRNGEVIGEFYEERRKLTSFEEFPQHLINAFVAAEDGSFFEHSGIKYKSIFRAFLANIKAGRKVQGGSTITQQMARSLLLSSQKTYTRKIKEILLALRAERHLTKEEILYLYLNQIYLGHGAYGVGMASQIYFKKDVKDLSLEESSLLAGLPQAPSRFSPIFNSKKAKERQRYVLSRMFQENYISQEQYDESIKMPVEVFMRENYLSKAPYFVETIRQILIDEIGKEALLTGGLTLHTSLDLNSQKKSQEALQKGLKELDKRQGFRGPLKNISEKEEQESFFTETEKKWIRRHKTNRIILENGEDGVLNSEFENLNFSDQVQGIVQKVEEDHAFVQLMFDLKGVISLKTTQWARKPDKNISGLYSQVSSLHDIFKVGDVVWVQIEDPQNHSKLQESLEPFLEDHLLLTLEQEPLVQGALISFDQETQDIISMVGGYDFEKSQFNRTYQSKRQTGSAYKPIIYSSALDKGFTPSSIISDEPVVYEDEEADILLQLEEDEKENSEDSENLEQEKSIWKPSNYSQRFSGDILFRNALIQSLNVPTVKVIEKVGIPWIEFYSRHLGITSSLNSDYTMALGSSSISLYEMTKIYSIFSRSGKRTIPLLIRKIENSLQEEVLTDVSLDKKFEKSIEAFQQGFKENWEEYWNLQAIATEEENEETSKKSKIFFKDINQVISKETAYLMTSLLQGVIFDSRGTGRRAQDIQRPLAGKTGTTNGYYDAWFIGYSPQIIAGVWVGFDDEQSLGEGEGGARAALPIWHHYMKEVHQSIEEKDFLVPENIVFANIDRESGLLADSASKEVVRQAFIEGTEPTQQIQKVDSLDYEDEQFLRSDF